MIECRTSVMCSLAHRAFFVTLHCALLLQISSQPLVAQHADQTFRPSALSLSTPLLVSLSQLSRISAMAMLSPVLRQSSAQMARRGARFLSHSSRVCAAQKPGDAAGAPAYSRSSVLSSPASAAPRSKAPVLFPTSLASSQALLREASERRAQQDAESDSNPFSASRRSPSIAELRAESGIMDPSDPEFKFKKSPGSSSRFILLAFYVGIPLLAYHGNATVRAWVDAQILALTQMYEAKYGKAVPATERPSPFAARNNPTPALPTAVKKAPAPETAAASKAAPAASAPAATGGSGSGSSSSSGGNNGGSKKDTEKKDAAKGETVKKTDETAAAPAVAVPAPVAVVVAAAAALPAASKPTPITSLPAVPKVPDAVELLALEQLRSQLDALVALERLAATLAPAVDAEIKTIADAINIGSEALPASRALKNLQNVFVSAGLTLPSLPAPPRWAGPPLNPSEARDRLQQIENFKQDYEVAVAAQTSALRHQLASELQTRLEDSFKAASSEFDAQLPLRLKHAELATKATLERSEMVELASLSGEIIAKKSMEWTLILGKEMEQQRKELERATEDVLARQKLALTNELEPLAVKELARIEAHKKEIARLQGELAKSAQIESTGARVHALTNLLISLEEALRLDEHRQPLFVSPPSSLPTQQVPAPKTGADLQTEWAKLLEVSKPDAALHKLAASIPLSSLSRSSPVAVASVATLRKAFNNEVERAVRQATFLPEHVADAEHSLPASLYARAVAAFSLREGQALRAPTGPTDDAARLNNASYHLNRCHDLASAVKELEQLSPRPLAQAAPWIAQAKQRVDVENVFVQVRTNVENTAKTYIEKGHY